MTTMTTYDFNGARLRSRLFRPGWLVAGIGLAVCLLNYMWLSFDKTPPHWDSANHLLSALKYREVFLSAIQGTGGPPLQILKSLVHIDVMVYPPLFPLTASFLSPMLTIRSLVMVNSVFVAILVCSTYQIGRRVYGELAGLVSATLIAAYPIVLHLEREFMVDFALLAVTALSAYLILASDDFRSPRETFLFGLSTALGLLAKPTYASFIAVPACYTLIRALRRTTDPAERPAQVRGLVRLAAGLAIGAFLASLWYVPNYEGVRSESVRIATSNPIGFDVLDANSLVYYLNILMIDQIGLPFVALFIYGLTVLRRYVAPAHFGFLISWVIGLYVIATLAPYKGTGQDIGILIPVSVISAVGLAGLTRFRTATCTAVLAFAAVQALVLSVPYPVLGARIGAFRWAGSYQNFPAPGDWQIEKALRFLGTRPLTIGMLSDYVYVNGNTLQYYVRSGNFPFHVLGRYGGDVNELLDADVIVAKSDWSLDVSTVTTRGRSLKGVSTVSVGVMYTRGQCVTERPDEPLTNILSQRDRELQGVSDASLRSRHPYVQGFPLPDGSQLLLYSKRPFEDLQVSLLKKIWRC